MKDRFYCSDLSGKVVELDEVESRHLCSVLRALVGTKVEVFDGKGAYAAGRVLNASNKKAAIELTERGFSLRHGLPEITIAASIAKGDRFDWLIEKCTELGINRIVPLIFDRTVKQAANPKIQQRWLNLAVSAAKQSRNNYLPDIAFPMKLESFLKTIKPDPQSAILFGSLEPEASPLKDFKVTGTSVACLIGPEGGITDAEHELLVKSKAVPVVLTETVLRVETAALAFAAFLSLSRKPASGGLFS